MNLFAMLLAVCGGLGLWFIVLGFTKQPLQVRRQNQLASLADQVGGESVQSGARGAADRVEKRLSARSALVQDAKMVGRSLESHAIAKLGGLVGGAALMGVAGLFLVVFLYSLPIFVAVLTAGVGGFAGWYLPDSILKTEAEKERKYFQQAAETWLELVAQLVTAGSDTFGALGLAASYSEQPVFVIIHNALRQSAASSEPPWTGLRRMADERRLRFLDPFCAALELAGTTGAGSRDAILSQVDAARTKALHEADAAAASSSEKMGAPLALMGGAFMILMGFPPMANMMNSAVLTGPGL